MIRAAEPRRRGRRVGVRFGCLLWLATMPLYSVGQEHAVVLVYHHVATDTPASTSVTPERFAEHLQVLADGGFQLLDLAALVDALVAGRGVPEHAVAITFDDAWRSIYTTARPMLEARGWPYTVFVSTAAVDQRLGGYMSWDELRRAAAGGARIANHSDTHSHLLERGADESVHQWRMRVVADIQQASRRIAEEIGSAPRLFAWPYGEFDAALLDMLDELGLIGFGQQSGPLGPRLGVSADRVPADRVPADRGALPRYPVSGSQSALPAFELRLQTAPLPAAVASELDWRRRHGEPEPPTLVLDLDGNIAAHRLTCYLGTGDRLQVRTDPGMPERVLISAERPLASGRAKYTCTAPRQDRPGAWYWYSHPWFVPTGRGTFPD